MTSDNLETLYGYSDDGLLNPHRRSIHTFPEARWSHCHITHEGLFPAAQKIIYDPELEIYRKSTQPYFYTLQKYHLYEKLRSYQRDLNFCSNNVVNEGPYMV